METLIILLALTTAAVPILTEVAVAATYVCSGSREGALPAGTY